MDDQPEKTAAQQEPEADAATKNEGDEAKKGEEADPAAKPRNIQYDSQKWDEIMKQEEEEDEDIAKVDVPVVAKVLTLAQFVEVCQQFKELKQAPEEKKAELKEVKGKIEAYITRQLDELSMKKLEEEPEMKGTLLELLMTIEKELAQEYFTVDGADLFPALFKHTFYGRDIKYSVCNNETLDREDLMFTPCEFEEVTVLESKVPKIERIESQINYVINNLLMRLTSTFEDKQMMLICIAELLYSQENFESTKRIAKILIFFAQMYASVEQAEKFKNEKNKFLMGSLFALGGLLKIEAKSYLMTVNEKADDDEAKADFDLVAPLYNDDNPADEKAKKYIRKLSPEDEVFFKKQFTKVVIWFIQNISKGLDQQVNGETFNLVLDLTYESYYDAMKELEKKEPEKLDKVLSSHFVTRLLLDFLQFSFAYFVKAEQVNEYMPPEKTIYDHRKPVDAQTDGGDIALLKLSYLIDNFEDLLRELMDALGRIWTNPFDLVKLWSIKFAEEPEKARGYDDTKDSYERTDLYDGQGVAVFAYLHMKKQINYVFRSEQANAAEDACLVEDSAMFMQMHKYQYLLEVCMPVMNFLLQQSVSHPNSKTLKQMGMEQAAFLVYMTEQGPLMADNPRPYTCAGHYTKDETQNLLFIGALFQIMCDRNLTYLKPTQFKLCMKVAYRCVNLYQSSSTVAEVFSKLYELSPHLQRQDQAVSVFTSSFVKPQLETRSAADPAEAEAMLPFIFDTLLPKSLDVLGDAAAYITDMTQQIQSGLNLLLFLKTRYGQHELFLKCQQAATKTDGHFDRLLLAFQTAHDALDQQIADYTKQQVENLESRVAAMRASQQTLTLQREVCRDLIAAFKA